MTAIPFPDDIAEDPVELFLEQLLMTSFKSIVMLKLFQHLIISCLDPDPKCSGRDD